MRIDPRPLLPTTTDKAPPVEGVRPISPRQGARFDALLSKREVLARRSLRGEVAQSGVTGAVNPELFGSARSLEILDYVLHTVLPALDAEPEIKTLAHELIREEIYLRRTLEQQRAEVQE